MLKSHKPLIGSGLVECKYNDDYMFVSVDTTNSMAPEKVMKSNLKYFIQNLKTDTIIKAISYEDLKRLITDKSLDVIGVTK